MPEIMDDLNAKVAKINGRLSQKRFIALMKNLFKVWTDKQIFDERLITGWMATLKLDKKSYLSCNIHDASFQIENTGFAKAFQQFGKIKQLVIQEIR